MPDNFLNFIKLGMGNAKSKRKGAIGRRKATPSFDKSARDPNGENGLMREQDFLIDIHERWADDPELKLIRRTIDIDPEMFILNNLMMCVQFFENFDEEINNIRQTLVSSREAELNARLPPHKHALIPDVLQQHVARRVDFTYMLPTLKHTIELLQPIRIYVVFDNIEVTEESYASQYCSVNETIVYSMQLKPNPGHRGYVQLQRLEVTPPKKMASADDVRMPSITNRTRDEIYSDGDSTYGSKFGKSKNGGAIARTTIVRDVKDADGAFKENNRSRSQDNIYDCKKSNVKKSDDKSAHGASNGDKEIGDETRTITRKDVEGRCNNRTSRNPLRQYGKTKLLGIGNGCSPAGSTSSGYRSENYTDIESDYSYAQTTYTASSHDTPKTSKSSLDEGEIVDAMSTEIPRYCFKKMEFRADGKIYDARRERKQKMTMKEQLIWQAHQSRNYEVWYLNSTKFMKYFCQIFTEQLAIPMGFDPDIHENAQGSVIYRNKVEVLEGTMSTKLETFEIVPCVSSQWPECAQEWLDRPRISWPHYNVIEKVKEFGCHMIPEGGTINDKPTNKFQDLEWQLIFPAAERFLETCLTYPQVRVYLIGLMLHKTFIRPVDSIFGLTTSHIKNRLFWLVEEDDRPIKWMENRTGEALMRLLNSLYRSISQDEPNLPDFFIKEKNLFQDKSYLLRTQKQLKRIIENPVMYVFHAMENIRHSRRFFPRLDYEELLRILMADTLTLVNPALAPRIPSTIASQNNPEKDYDHVRGFWDDVKQKTNEKPKTYLKKPVTNKSLINPRKAYDEVVEIPIRCASMEPRRLSCLLDFFIKHFIKMAECCHKYGAMPQKTAYIEQAERLSVLLLEHQSHKEAAKNYLQKLCSLKRRAASSRSQSEPPKTPRRNPDMPVFTRPLKDRFQSTDNEEDNRVASETRERSEDESDDDNNGTLRPNVTRVVIHDENTENVNNVELNSSSDSSTTEKHAERKKRSTRIVSLSDKPESSFLTETTYI